MAWRGSRSAASGSGSLLNAPSRGRNGYRLVFPRESSASAERSIRSLEQVIRSTPSMFPAASTRVRDPGHATLPDGDEVVGDAGPPARRHLLPLTSDASTTARNGCSTRTCGMVRFDPPSRNRDYWLVDGLQVLALRATSDADWRIGAVLIGSAPIHQYVGSGSSERNSKSCTRPQRRPSRARRCRTVSGVLEHQLRADSSDPQTLISGCLLRPIGQFGCRNPAIAPQPGPSCGGSSAARRPSDEELCPLLPPHLVRPWPTSPSCENLTIAFTGNGEDSLSIAL